MTRITERYCSLPGKGWSQGMPKRGCGTATRLSRSQRPILLLPPWNHSGSCLTGPVTCLRLAMRRASLGMAPDGLQPDRVVRRRRRQTHFASGRSHTTVAKKRSLPLVPAKTAQPECGGGKRGAGTHWRRYRLPAADIRASRTIRSCQASFSPPFQSAAVALTRAAGRP